MSQSIAFSHHHNPNLSPPALICGTAMMGCAGAAAAAMFTPISPFGGAIFGASHFLSNHIIVQIFRSFNCCPDNTIAKISTCVLSMISSIAVAAAVTTAAGVTMTFSSGVVLTMAIIAVAISTILALGGCLCSSMIATGVALGNSETAVRV